MIRPYRILFPHALVRALDRFPRATFALLCGYLVGMAGMMAVGSVWSGEPPGDRYDGGSGDALRAWVFLLSFFLYGAGAYVGFLLMEHARAHGRYRWVAYLFFSALLAAPFYLRRFAPKRAGTVRD